MKKCLSIAALMWVGLLHLNAQDLNGFWKGNLTMYGGCFPTNNIEIQITIVGDSVTGNSYHYLDINNYVKKKLRGSYNKTLKKIILNELFVTTFKIPSHCRVCIKNYELLYSRDGSLETLKGGWDGKIMGTQANCSIGPIVLSRTKESAFKEIPEIIVDTGEIRLDFYDNAEIDGDSITVLVNKKVILTHQKLSAQAITTYIKIDLQNTFQEVEMIAENLGTIPPNTAILIITAGKKRYELFLTSTAAKSAKVRFIYEEIGAPL